MVLNINYAKVLVKKTLKVLARVFLYITFIPVSLSARDINPSPAFTSEQLLADPTTDWVTNGGNIYNQRYSPLTELTPENIADLKAVWRTSLQGSATGFWHSNQTQILVYEGIMYIITGENDVFAVSVDRGEVIWKYQSNLSGSGLVLCCGWVARGVAMGEGRIYFGQLDAKLVALDQRTGEVVWTVQAEDPGKGYSITSAPLYYNGMVITGFAGGEFGIRGRVKAYDADDGSLLWTFYTIPGPGETGHASWPQDNNAWQTGGAPMYQTPAVDPELGLLYFSTGNPAPDQNGSQRAGDNLFSVSIVAIDVNSGEYRWHFQQVRHDIWDYDSPNPVILFDAEYDGVMRKGIAGASKSGYLYILDRTNGEPLVPVDYVDVPQLFAQRTATTQPVPTGDKIISHTIGEAPEGWTLINNGETFTPFGTTPSLYTPLSGISWPPNSYDPETNLMYICANESVGGARMIQLTGEGPQPPEPWMGGEWVIPSATRRGIFAAMDMKNHQLAWRQVWENSCHTGSVVTKGGLVFVGHSDGRLTALNKSNGSLLWEFQTDGGVNTIVSVFEHKGRQNVAVYAGGIAFRSKRNDGVWLFSLDGKYGPLASIDSLPPDEVKKRTIMMLLNEIFED